MKNINKSDLEFYQYEGKLYYGQGTAADENGNTSVIMKAMFGDYGNRIFSVEQFESFKHMGDDEMRLYTNSLTNDEYSEFSSHRGAYICPFCGGRLRWESDFMTSEVRGLEHGYYKVTEPERIDDIKVHEDEYVRIGLMGVTDDIDGENMKVLSECTYRYAYLKHVKDGQEDTYWEIDDPVIGIWVCTCCGKNYEVQDAYTHTDEDESWGD